MPTADAYIQALQRRMRLHAYRTRGTNGMPPGWAEWFESLPKAPPTHAHADALVAQAALRPPRPPERAGPDPGPWRAFLATWRQGWDPPDPEERPLRIAAGGISVLWHLLLLFAMLWLLLTGFDPSAATRLGEEDVVQVEFIGEGVPAEVGGGEGEPAQSGPAPAAPAATEAPAVPAKAPAVQAVAGAAAPVPPAAPEPAAVEAAVAEPALPAPAFEVPRPEVPTEPLAAAPQQPVEREIPMPAPREQPLQVSEPVPDTSADFLLPPPTIDIERSLATPELRPAEPQPVQREIPPPPRRLSPAPLAAPGIDAAQLEMPVGAAREREIPMPAPATPLPPAPQLRVQAPATPDATLEAGQRTVRQRGIPMPAIATRPEGAGAADSAAPAPEAAVADAAGGEATARPAESTAATTEAAADPGGVGADDSAAASAGPRPVPAPGAWPDPARADGWGASDRVREGSQAGELSGLYDSAGRVRLAETPGSSASGNPPGTITEEIAHLDRAGTWLRRPPIGYEPTSLDRFWRPNETLLEEWVRRSVTTVRIPIPGTSKTLVCQTVLLAAGGGCGIEDPNMVEQPASARPPPDIPFKPELQEGGGAAPAG